MPDAKTKGPVPRLRFPEFRDAGPWELKELSAVLSYEQPSRFIVSTDIYDTSGTPVLTPGKTFILGYTHESCGVYRNIPVIIFDDFTTESRYVNFPFKVKSSAVKILSARPGYSLKFVYEAMGVIGFDASQHKRYWIGEYQHLMFPFPSYLEQKKIADCLSSLDDLIRAEEEHLAVLKEHKKGLMQQLFPALGETIPRLRFPEFRNAGPWAMRSLKEVVEKIVQGGTPKTSIETYWNGEIPWITPAEMGDDAANHYTYKTLRSISVEGLKNSAAELLPKNSVIISSRAPIGYATINKVEMATNQGCKGLIPKKEIYHEFLYFSLLFFNGRLNDLGAGAGFKEISTSTLKNFQIPVPQYPEQRKIADCLSSLDDLIRAQGNRIAALKQHKKGLMQQLFPQKVD